MRRLYALEANEETLDKENNLLIDKVLQYSKQPKDPISLTKDILKQRLDLKADIVKQLNTPAGDTDDNTDDGQDGEDDLDDADEGSKHSEPHNDDSDDDDPSKGDKSDDEEGEDKSSKSDNDDSDDKESSKEDKSSDTNKDKDKAESDDSEAAADKDSLKKLVGSGLSDSSPKEEKKEPATESYSVKPDYSNLFSSLKEGYTEYVTSLESYNLVSHKLSLEEQPVAYVKESVVKALNGLITLSTRYIANNTAFVATTSSTAKDINEKITVFAELVKAEKYSFTNTVIADQDLISRLSCPGKSSPRETVKLLINYVDDATRVNSLVLTNTFDKLQGCYTTSGYEKQGEDFVYPHIVPGFSQIRVSVPSYKSYLNTDIQEYQYYKLKILRTQELYDLNPICIDKDKDLKHSLEFMDRLLANIALSTDNLCDINTNFAKYVDELKAVSFDVEKGKYSNLAELDIDSKIQDYIKLKLVIESTYINISVMLDYMAALLVVINSSVKLST